MSSSRTHRGESYTEPVSKRDAASRQEDRLIQLIEARDTIELYKRLLKKIEKGSLDVTGFMKAASVDAAVVTVNIMHGGENDKVRLEAAKEVMDRGGYGKTQKIALHGHLNVDHDTSKMELINLILSSARKSGLVKVRDDEPLLSEPKPVGPVIDVEPSK
jgi:hypothetical protein